MIEKFNAILGIVNFILLVYNKKIALLVEI